MTGHPATDVGVTSPATAGTVDAVTVYWRQHCPYCVRLRWQLRRARLPTREINIWEDKAAAARVRSITGGDETVPTVVIGSVSLVNPTLEQTLTAVRAEAPHFAEQGAQHRRRLRDRLACSRHRTFLLVGLALLTGLGWVAVAAVRNRWHRGYAQERAASLRPRLVRALPSALRGC
jgi:glutaredoxin